MGVIVQPLEKGWTIMRCFPSTNDLTWQGQGPSNNPMESSHVKSNLIASDPDYSEGDENNLSNSPKRAEDGRLMYFEHMVQPVRDYRGPLLEIPFEEVRKGLVEALKYTGVCTWHEIPLPPAGLPGKLHEQYDEQEDAWGLLTIGMAYVRAVAFNERRGMHNRWQEARDFIKKIEERAVRAYVDEEIARSYRSEQSAPKQQVYFIASESGPIKIGIAANPLSRLSGLQTSHHEKLTLLATCKGGVDQERAYHKQFAEHRLSGEWFARVPEIEAEIDRLAQ